ncbi:Uncharacterised protein [Mycobacteroides abscessus subsp. abscessus]|nr:Uncharacterised protein [Mycobacteroides abscessus subsp. abscessus]
MIDPFSTTYLATAEGSETRTTSQFSDGERDSTLPVPSTCPCTMCPPSRLLTAAARSRLTLAPAAILSRLDRASVSPITSVVKTPPSRTSTTVRHTPLTAIESPCFASSTTRGPSTVRRAESPRSSLPRISPSSSTIPVNIRQA